MSEKLFNPVRNKKIIAYDIYGQAHQRDLVNFKFRPSVYGVLIKGNHVLLKRHPSITQYELPGGGIELNETIDQGLVREFKEETGLEIEIGKVLHIEDSFFTHDNEDAHGILIFYQVHYRSGQLSPQHEDSAEASYIPANKLTPEVVHRSCWSLIPIINDLTT